MSFSQHPATTAVRASLESDSQYGAVIPPLHLSSNYTFAGFAEKRQYDYCRSGNPTRDALAEALAALEGGAGAVITSSGMAALTLLTQLLQPGELLIAPHDCYGGTYRLFESLSAKGHFEVLFVDQSDAATLRQAFARKPKLILVETPSNPLLRIVDIESVVDAARACGALIAVDNTFLTPYYQRPLELGADLVIHSTTKYMDGHNATIGGAAVAGSRELDESLRFIQNATGTIMSPQVAWLTLQGSKTLSVRMDRQSSNAMKIAKFLEAHPAVERVGYPGLESFPQHELAAKQASGFGAMVWFEIKGGLAAGKALMDSIELWSLAESLGSVESLVTHPASMTHSDIEPERRRASGISDGLIRLSVGLEDVEDLIAALRAALDRVV